MPGGLEATPDHAPGKICRGLGARGQLVATPGREFLCSAPGAAPQTLRTQSRMKLVNIAHLMKNAETFPSRRTPRSRMFPSVIGGPCGCLFFIRASSAGRVAHSVPLMHRSGTSS
jgi:hypothetical protein